MARRVARGAQRHLDHCGIARDEDRRGPGGDAVALAVAGHFPERQAVAEMIEIGTVDRRLRPDRGRDRGSPRPRPPASASIRDRPPRAAGRSWRPRQRPSRTRTRMPAPAGDARRAPRSGTRPVAAASAPIGSAAQARRHGSRPTARGRPATAARRSRQSRPPRARRGSAGNCCARSGGCTYGPTGSRSISSPESS